MFRVVYRPETALTEDLIDTDRVEILRGEDMVVFDPVIRGGKYRRAVPIPLRFVESVMDQDGRVLFDRR